jgi:CMP/dCMP kinase
MMTVITISRQYGSKGDEIADRLCQILGYHPFGKIQITQAAFEAGLSSADNIDYSEENYKVKNFFERLFKRQTRVTQVHIWKEDEKGKRSVETINIDEEAALSLVQKAILAAYKEDNMIIIGRGGQVLLKGKTNVLHIRIEADLEDRIQTVRQHLREARKAYGEIVELRREAQDIITEHDNASSAYLREFYNVDWADPALYDLVINTSFMDIETAIKKIVEKEQSLHLQPAR